DFMDKRIFLAVVLTIGVIALTQLIFPPAQTTPVTDSVMVMPSPAATQEAVPDDPLRPDIPDLSSGVDAASAQDTVAGDTTAQQTVARAQTTTVSTPVSTWEMTNVGAAPVGVQLETFRSLRNGARDPDAERVQIVRPDESLVSYAVAVPGDTVRFADVPFRVSELTGDDGQPVLEYRAAREGIQLAIRYAFVPDSYLVRVSAVADGAPARSFLMVGLPRGINSAESDTLDDQQHLAYAYKPRGDGASSIGFGKLDPGERRFENGPLTWVAAKNKYFIVGLLTPEGGEPFAELTTIGGPRTGERATNAIGTVLMPLGDNGARFE